MPVAVTVTLATRLNHDRPSRYRISVVHIRRVMVRRRERKREMRVIDADALIKLLKDGFKRQSQDSRKTFFFKENQIDKTTLFSVIKSMPEVKGNGK